jgi:hypothetical protein
MRVTSFTLERPDSDGDISSEATIKFENPTGEVVRLITAASTVLGPLGFPVACTSTDTEECVMEPGGTHNGVIGVSRTRAVLAGPDPSRVELVVSATLHAREFFKLGETSVPQTEQGWTTHEHAVSSRAVESPVRIFVRRGENSDDGTTELEWRASLRNIADYYIERAQLKCELLDAEDSVLDSSAASISIEAGLVTCVTDSIYSIRKGQLRDAKLKFTMSVFRPVHTATARAAGGAARM